MPYITKRLRELLVDKDAIDKAPLTPGELNFVLTSAINEYIRANELSYQTINDIIGALEGAKMEFYRRVAVPYENAKMTENGDVYEW
jgi:hypothetical protein